MIRKITDQSLSAEFILDRLALGLSPAQIKESCKEQLDLAVSLSSIKNYQKDNALQIKARKQELQEDIARSSPSVLARLETISSKIESLLDGEKDMEMFAKLVSPYLRNLELIGKVLGEIKEEQVIIQQAEMGLESTKGLEFLEENGMILIKDREKLQNLIR